MPSIRKTGSYSLQQQKPSEDEMILNTIHILQGRIEKQKQLLLEANTKIQIQKETLEEQEPKVECYELFMEFPNESITIEAYAKIINRNKVGRNKMFTILRDLEILNYENLPYQFYINKGYFEVRMVETNIGFKPQTLITKIGMKELWILKLRDYFYPRNRFIDKFVNAV